MNKLLAHFAIYFFSINLALANDVEPQTKSLNINRSGTQSLELASQIFGPGGTHCYSDYTPSCDDVTCRDVTTQECDTTTTQICKNGAFDCRDITSTTCYPVTNTVCEAPNPCTVSGDPNGTVCEPTRGDLQSTSHVKLEVTSEALGRISPVSLQATLNNQALSFNAKSSVAEDKTLVLLKEGELKVLSDTDTERKATQKLFLKALSLHSFKAKVRFEELKRKRFTLSGDFFQDPDLNQAPVKISMKITNRDGDKVFTETTLNNSNSDRLPNGDIEVEFFRVGFKTKFLRRYQIEVKVELDKAALLSELKQKYGEEFKLINAKEITAEDLTGSFVDRF